MNRERLIEDRARNENCFSFDASFFGKAWKLKTVAYSNETGGSRFSRNSENRF